VHPPPVMHGRAVVERRADQRMPEPHRRPEGQKILLFGSSRRIGRNAQVIRGSPQQLRVTSRVSGNTQQEKLGIGRKTADLPEKPGFQPPPERQRIRQRHLPVQLARGQLTTQLDKTQRVPGGLGDYPGGNQPIDPAAGGGREQLLRFHRRQAPQLHVRQPVEPDRTPRRLPHGKDHRNAIGQKPPGHERQNRRRFPIQPLRIIHHAQDRPIGGGRSQQAQ
jgi:hypothetical protein